MQKILETENLTKKYKNGRGIENINLVVNQGDIVGLLGPNGSGKTTIMKAIAGLIHHDSGRIMIFGHDTKTEACRGSCGCGFFDRKPSALSVYVGVSKSENGGAVLSECRQ